MAVEEGDKLLGRYLTTGCFAKKSGAGAVVAGSHDRRAAAAGLRRHAGRLYPLARESLLAHLLALVSRTVARRPQPSGEDHFVLCTLASGGGGANAHEGGALQRMRTALFRRGQVVAHTEPKVFRPRPSMRYLS